MVHIKSFLSIIIPVLNEAAVVRRCLSNLPHALCGSIVEVIFVDGGSIDDTHAILTASPYRIVVSKPGRAEQMNSGAAVASGQYLLFLHVDTELPGAMAQVINSWLHGVVWGFFSVRLDGCHWSFRLIERCITLRSSITHVATGDQGIFVLRSTWEALGGFKRLPLMEDVELSKRLRRIARPRVEKLSVVTSSRRWQRNGIIRTVLLMWGLRFGYWVGVDPQLLAHWYRR